MNSKRRLEGYISIDHTASPGMPNVPGGQHFESAIVICSHCQVTVVLNPDRTRPRGYCSKCDKYICDKPSCNIECIPMDKVLDDLQEQAFKNLNIKEI